MVMEEGVPKTTFFKRRIKRLGLWKVVGQIAFLVSVSKYLSFISSVRRRDIIREYALNFKSPPNEIVKNVSSINDSEVQNILREEQPDIVVINGTGIINKKTLSASKAPIINIHAGITPAYRGVHGAFWAITEKKPELAGVTVHQVDTGIDTGQVLAQKVIDVTSKDNFATYPLIQLAEGLLLLKNVLDNFEINGLKPKDSIATNSKLYSHPTIFEYLKYRLRAVK